MNITSQISALPSDFDAVSTSAKPTPAAAKAAGFAPGNPLPVMSVNNENVCPNRGGRQNSAGAGQPADGNDARAGEITFDNRRRNVACLPARFRVDGLQDIDISQQRLQHKIIAQDIPAVATLAAVDAVQAQIRALAEAWRLLPLICLSARLLALPKHVQPVAMKKLSSFVAYSCSSCEILRCLSAALSLGAAALRPYLFSLAQCEAAGNANCRDIAGKYGITDPALLCHLHKISFQRGAIGAALVGGAHWRDIAEEHQVFDEYLLRLMQEFTVSFHCLPAIVGGASLRRILSEHGIDGREHLPRMQYGIRHLMARAAADPRALTMDAVELHNARLFAPSAAAEHSQGTSKRH